MDSVVWHRLLNVLGGGLNIVSSIVLGAVGTDLTFRPVPTQVDVSYLGLLLSTGLISGLLHLYVSALDRNTINGILESGHNPYRWVDYGITSPIMVVVIASISGQLDIWTLVDMALLQSLLMLVSGMAETASDRRVGGALAIYHVVGVWGPIFDAIDAAPDFVYVIVAVLLMLFLSFGVVYLLDLTPKVSELSYVTLGITSKIMLQWLLYGGVTKRGGPALGGIVVGLLGGGALFFGVGYRSLTSGWP